MARCILGSEFQIISGCDAAQGLWDIVRLFFFKSQKRSWTFADQGFNFMSHRSLN